MQGGREGPKAKPLFRFFSLVDGLSKKLVDWHTISNMLILYYKLPSLTILKNIPQGSEPCGINCVEGRASSLAPLDYFLSI